MKIVLHRDYTAFDPAIIDHSFDMLYLANLITARYRVRQQLKQIKERENAFIAKQKTRSV